MALVPPRHSAAQHEAASLQKHHARAAAAERQERIRERILGNKDQRHAAAGYYELFEMTGEGSCQRSRGPSADEVVGADGAKIIGRAKVMSEWVRQYRSTLRPHVRPAASRHHGRRYAETVAEADADGSVAGPIPVTAAQRRLNRPFDVAEVAKHLRSTKRGKAAGPGGVSPDLWKDGAVDPDQDPEKKKTARPSALLVQLTRLFNEMLADGTKPAGWCDVHTHPIYKGKGNRASPDNYRPISIGCSLFKMMATVIQHRLLEFVEKSGMLGEAQFGFRWARRAEDALHVLVETVRMQWRQRVHNPRGEGKYGQYRRVWALFFDVAKAYDAVDHDVLFALLWRAGIRGRMYRLLRVWYKDVRKHIKLGGATSEPFQPTAGVAQGDPTSTTLFLVYFTAIAAGLGAEELHTQSPPRSRERAAFVRLRREMVRVLFADDLVILAESRRQLQHMMDMLGELLGSVNAAASMAKLRVMVFSPPGTSYPQLDDIQVMFRGERVTPAQEVTYMGVKLTHTLCFTAQLQSVIGKLTGRAIAATKARTTFGVDDPRLVRTLLFSLAVSIPDYAAAVWLPTEADSAAFTQIDKCLDKSIGYALGARGAPVAGLRGEMGWLGMYARAAWYRLRYLAHMVFQGDPDSSWLPRLHRECVHEIVSKGIDAVLRATPQPGDSWVTRSMRQVHSMGLPVQLVLYPRQMAQLLGSHNGYHSAVAAFGALAEAFGRGQWRRQVRESGSLMRVRHNLVHPEPQFAVYLDSHGNAARCRRTRLRLNIFHAIGDVQGRWAGLEPEDRGPCGMCGADVVETVQHMLVQCPAFDSHRRMMVEAVLQRCPTDFRALLTPFCAHMDRWLQLILGGACVEWAPRGFNSRRQADDSSQSPAAVRVRLQRPLHTFVREVWETRLAVHETDRQQLLGRRRSLQHGRGLLALPPPAIAVREVAASTAAAPGGGQ